MDLHRVSANILIYDSPFPHVFPPICLRQSPTGRGNTRHAHFRDSPLIMSLATWVEKQDSQVAGVLSSGAWHSLSRHPVARVSFPKKVSACISTHAHAVKSYSLYSTVGEIHESPALIKPQPATGRFHHKVISSTVGGFNVKRHSFECLFLH